MSDNDGRKAISIPIWQRGETQNTPSQSKEPSQEHNEQTSAPRASLIAKAARFLEDQDIRTAPIARKREFLEAKGLNEAEIYDLLDTQPTSEAKVAQSSNHEHQRPHSPTSNPPQQQAALTTPDEPPLPPPPKDVPPIITYPEFLLHSPTPAPLITAPLLLKTLYLTSGASATIYATNKYFLTPMLDSLSSSRHSLFFTVSANLTSLNQKLESAVSKLPEPTNEGDYSDIDTASSDPARFFNRSAGTQTSPRLSRSTSCASSVSTASSSAFVSDESRLSSLQTMLSDLLPANATAPDPVTERVEELRSYLGRVRYGNLGEDGKGSRKGDAEGVAKLKAEIRGVKGVLLSARNFPSRVGTR